MTVRIFKRGIVLALCLLIAICPLFAQAEDFRDMFSNMEYEEEILKKYRYDEYERLYEHVVMEAWDVDDPNFATQSRAMQALHVVLTFDMEIQNGGVAQFFWNQGSACASLVPDMLREMGLDDVAVLYEQFMQENQITLAEIDTYRERFPHMGEEFYSLHPFDDFDLAYVKIWAETNLNSRFLDYAEQHPEFYGVI